MVDPNRKINRLTDKDIEFLEECEQEFCSRFTENDTEFMQYCSKPLDDPPIIENWNNSSGGDFFRNEGGGRHHNRFGGNRNWRSNFGEKRRGGHSRYRSFDQQETSRDGPHMKIRRKYNNFVAASNDN